MAAHPLAVLLNHQLADDKSAVHYLPHVLPSLSPQHFHPSPHLQKWITRVNSLIHSKDPSSRWAGYCLAGQTAILSKVLMMENAQSWTGAALPLLSKNEPVPNVKAAIRLLLHIFSAATDVSEFQRQLATPNVPKFSLALIGIAEKHADHELKLFAIRTLVQLVPLYPTLHKSLHGALSAFCLRQLRGSAPKPTPCLLLEATSLLYSVLPAAGGKVGAASLWRKSVDSTMSFAWGALASLRTTFPQDDRLRPWSGHHPLDDDHLLAVPLNLDRLRCAVVALCHLLRSPSSRPVQMPIGPLVQLLETMLACTADEKLNGTVDPITRALEETALSDIWRLGSDLFVCFIQCARHHLTSHLSRFLGILAFHLERPLTSVDRISFLRILVSILTYAHTIHHPILPTRLTKTVLSSLSILLRSKSMDEVPGAARTGNKSRKGKKAMRNYEGDEVFNISNDIICPTSADGDMVLVAFDALRLLLRNPYVSLSAQSIASRVLLAANMSLSTTSPSRLSRDLALHAKVVDKIQALCLELGAGTSSILSKSLPLVILGLSNDQSNPAISLHSDSQRALDLLLHPRLPPLIRSLPHVEALSLFRAEESAEERTIREGLHIGIVEQEPQTAETTSLANVPAISATTHHATTTSIPPLNQPITSPKIPPPAVTGFASSVPSTSDAAFTTPQPLNEQKKSAVAENSSSMPPPPVPANFFSVTPAMGEDDEDEEMPSIDLGSDSE